MNFIKKFLKKKLNLAILAFLLLILYITISNRSIKEGLSSTSPSNIYCNSTGSGSSSLSCGSGPAYMQGIGTCAYTYGPGGTCTLGEISCNDLLSRCVDSVVPDVNTPAGNIDDQIIQQTCSAIQGQIVSNANIATTDCPGSSNVNVSIRRKWKLK
jgi:hypothetical protein